MFLINIIITSYNTSAHNLDSLHKLPILINKSFQYGYFNQFSSKNKFYENEDLLKLKKFNSYIIPHKRLEIQETENIDKIKKKFINKIIIYLRPYYEFIGTINNFTSFNYDIEKFKKYISLELKYFNKKIYTEDYIKLINNFPINKNNINDQLILYLNNDLVSYVIDECQTANTNYMLINCVSEQVYIVLDSDYLYTKSDNANFSDLAYSSSYKKTKIKDKYIYKKNEKIEKIVYKTILDDPIRYIAQSILILFSEYPRTPLIAGYGKLSGKSKFKILDNIIKKIHKIYSNIINFSYVYLFISFLILLKERKSKLFDNFCIRIINFIF